MSVRQDIREAIKEGIEHWADFYDHDFPDDDVADLVECIERHLAPLLGEEFREIQEAHQG